MDLRPDLRIALDAGNNAPITVSLAELAALIQAQTISNQDAQNALAGALATNTAILDATRANAAAKVKQVVTSAANYDGVADIVELDSTGGAFNFNMTAPTAAMAGKEVTVYLKAGSSNVKIPTATTGILGLIGAGTNLLFSAVNNAVKLVAVNGKWVVATQVGASLSLT